MDVNNRYEMLGHTLGERQSQLQLTDRAVSDYDDQLRSLSSWIDDKELIILPLKTLSANEHEAADKLKEHQV